MNDLIFKSKIWLTMKDHFIEKSYNEFRSKSIISWVNILSVVGVIVTLINLVIQILIIGPTTGLDVIKHTEILNLSYTILGLNTVLSILTVSIRNIKAKKVVYFLQYIALGIPLFALVFSVAFFDPDHSLGYNLYGIEALVRIFNNVGIFEFTDCFILTMVEIFLIIPLYFYFTRDQANSFVATYVTFTLCFMVVSYFITYIRKMSFYYSEENRKGRDWFKNIIENMKSGFINVRENKICFVNEVMKEWIRNSKILNNIRELQRSKDNHSVRDVFFEIEDFSTQILDDLMKDVNIEPEYRSNHSNSLSVSPLNASKLPFFEIIKNKLCHSENNFTLIGTKTLHLENSSYDEMLTLEVFCRYQLSQETKKDEFEIIFNDITKAKQTEERKSEIKYKSLFLSKVAHEFKNPLICIMELVNQLKENLEKVKERDGLTMDCEENLNQINSFSNYLMILIKDLDYFSQKEIQMKNIPLEKEDFELKETLKFCNDIAISLLKRNGKEKSIEFEIKTENEVPEIVTTDESKLKQVLVNLISNAIKFTNKGKVAVNISKKESDIKFLVSDTGVGIDPTKVNNLFAPYNSFTKSKSINPHGSGLGMSIIYDLTNALGKKIEFNSELGKGSDFFFTIPIKIKRNKNSSQTFKLNQPPNSIENHYPSTSRNLTTKIKKFEEYFPSESYHELKQEISQDCQDGMTRHFTLPKISNEKSLFFYNNTSKIDEIRKIFRQDNIVGNNYIDESKKIEYYDGIDDSLMDISERNICSEIRIKKFCNKSMLQVVKPNYIDSEIKIEINPSVFLETINLSDNQRKKLELVPLINSDNSMDTLNKNLKLSKSRTENVIKQDHLYLDLSACNDTTSNLDLSSHRSGLLSKRKEILSDFLRESEYLDPLILSQDPGILNIILVDDEILTRSANRRLISVYAKKNNILVNFIEAEDGLECLYILYVCIKNGVKISCVISDQSMIYVDGTITATVMKQETHNDAFLNIPFYIVTAYEDENIIKKLKRSPVKNVFTKPIKKAFIEQIFSEIQ